MSEQEAGQWWLHHHYMPVQEFPPEVLAGLMPMLERAEKHKTMEQHLEELVLQGATESNAQGGGGSP